MKTTFKALPESDISLLMTDVAKIPAYLHLPREDHDSYWLNAEEKSDVLELTNALTPIHYLLTGHTENEATKKYEWQSPRKILRLEKVARRQAQFCEVFLEDLYTGVRCGKIQEGVDAYPSVSKDISMMKLREHPELQALYGFPHVETHGSRGELADYIFDIIRARVAAGFKFVFPDLLPPPESPSIAHVLVKTRHKRKATKPPSGQPEAKRTHGSSQPAAALPSTTGGEGTSGAREVEPQEGQARRGERPPQRYVTLVSIVDTLIETPVTGTSQRAQGGEAQPQVRTEGGEEGRYYEDEEEEVEEYFEEHKTLPHPTKLKMKELKDELQARGLPTTGRRDDLVTRLCIALSNVPVPGQEMETPVYDPFDLLVTGGIALVSEVFEYGAARALSSLQVQELDASLQNMSEYRLRSNFDIRKMRDLAVGPDIFYDVPEEQVWSNALEGFKLLRDFLHGVAGKSYGLIIY